MPKKPITPPNLDKDEIRRLANAHAPTNDRAFPVVDYRVAALAHGTIATKGSTIAEHIKVQGDHIHKEWQNVLEPIPSKPGAYVITDDLLRGLIARIGIMAAMQVLLESGAALLRQQETNLPEPVDDPDIAQRDDMTEPLAASN